MAEAPTIVMVNGDLRDWFAGQALAGMMASPMYHDLKTVKQLALDAGISATEFEDTVEFPACARGAYKIADAMLAERNKNAAAIPADG